MAGLLWPATSISGRGKGDATLLADKELARCSLYWAIEWHDPSVFIFSETRPAFLMRP